MVNKILSIGLFLLVTAGVPIGCAGEVELLETPAPTPSLQIPAGVLAAQRAVLAFLRDGANECVPPQGVEWRRKIGAAPAGYDVYVMESEGCFMTVSYSLPEASDADYHVALHNGVTGFCWQALVDEEGEVTATGTRAELPAKLAQAAADYCEEQGYRHEVEEQPDGTRCGVCFFDDQTSCKAWAYYQALCNNN